MAVKTTPLFILEYDGAEATATVEKSGAVMTLKAPDNASPGLVKTLTLAAFDTISELVAHLETLTGWNCGHAAGAAGAGPRRYCNRNGNDAEIVSTDLVDFTAKIVKDVIVPIHGEGNFKIVSSVTKESIRDKWENPVEVIAPVEETQVGLYLFGSGVNCCIVSNNTAKDVWVTPMCIEGEMVAENNGVFLIPEGTSYDVSLGGRLLITWLEIYIEADGVEEGLVIKGTNVPTR